MDARARHLHGEGIPTRTSLIAATLLIASLSTFPMGQADASCPPANGHVWFLGVVDDSEERDDFKVDVFNFEAYLEELRDVYCIPDSQAEILAFDGSFTRGSPPVTYTYTEATEENVKSYLDTFGTAASAHTDSIFFFFLSSHGIQYAEPLSPCATTRTYGSLSALHNDPPTAQDGDLYDCELGAALNTEFDSDVRMVVAVDCSFCGGFSDSLTAVSGTVKDGAPTSSGVPGDLRVVMTGCSMTTECFGGGEFGGGVFYDNLRQGIDLGPSNCDGWTSPGFPTVQGFDVPIKHVLLPTTDGTCTASEWFFQSVRNSYLAPIDPIAIQQQFRIKYGSALTSDIQVMA